MIISEGVKAKEDALLFKLEMVIYIGGQLQKSNDKSMYKWTETYDSGNVSILRTY